MIGVCGAAMCDMLLSISKVGVQTVVFEKTDLKQNV